VVLGGPPVGGVFVVPVVIALAVGQQRNPDVISGCDILIPWATSEFVAYGVYAPG